MDKRPARLKPPKAVTVQPKTVRPVRSVGTKAFSVVYKQPVYRAKYPLRWETVKSPNSGRLPDWQSLSRMKPGLSMPEVRNILGSPRTQSHTSLSEWNYLYRYMFGGTMQQCQYKVVFDKRSGRVDGLFWEPVGNAHCKH
ncbi:outer membrane protein assembly factor BamE [Neisseria weaveri]|uniref:Lipoprotein n=1 Tax=Neisseria weaveri TaxID=28091 RepID=A0A448VPF8_9NEIS|nr:outer membrane protein assembly factor BamE [Neisseria weaveri]SAY50197.1 lipoprotein [Neisseria weaveri]VEJ51602.1 lipoprotein [Neisseria weaveri]